MGLRTMLPLTEPTKAPLETGLWRRNSRAVYRETTFFISSLNTFRIACERATNDGRALYRHNAARQFNSRRGLGVGLRYRQYLVQHTHGLCRQRRFEQHQSQFDKYSIGDAHR